MPERSGRVLVLNGTSSAGKTTLANALQKALPDQYGLVGLDLALWSLPPELVVVTDDVDHPPVEGWLVPIRDGVQVALPTAGPRALELLETMYATFAARADAGENLIVDDALWHPHALAMAVAYFSERDAWLIDVYCPIEVAVEHERRRGDRALGGAALFYEPIYRHAIYDLRVDTSLLTPDEEVQQVMNALSSGRSPTAFRRLRSKTG
jgi:chloramphenicol 3-O phosphotransferase